MFNRFDICEAFAMYDMLWGPTPYGARLRKIGFSPSPTMSLESLSPEAKAIYGKLVKNENSLYVGYSRYQKRNKNAPSWPGAYNMRGGASKWLQSIGALAAVYTYIGVA